MEEFYLKTIVGGNPAAGEITVYLFSKNKNLAIPLKLAKSSTDALLLAQQNILHRRPLVHDTIDRLIKSLGSKVVDVYVYMLMDNVYYTYLRVFTNGRTVEIDTKFTDGLCVAIRCNCPIVFEEAVLKQIALALE